MIQWMLAIYLCFFLPFLNSACTSGSSHILLKLSLKDCEHYLAGYLPDTSVGNIIGIFLLIFISEEIEL